MQAAKVQLQLAVATELHNASDEKKQQLNSLLQCAENVEKNFALDPQKSAEYITALNDFSEQAQEIKSGKQNIPIKVIGALSLFLGIAMIAASILLAIYLPPASPIFMVHGINIMLAGLAACGLIATGSGIFAIWHGREKGVAKAIKNFEAIAQPVINS